jgi:hypothetical protein
MSRRSKYGRWLVLLPLALVVVLLATPASTAAPGQDPSVAISADTLSVEAGAVATPSGNVPSPEPPRPLNVLPTPQDAYNPAVARLTTKPGVAAEGPFGPPAGQLSFPGEDIGVCCLRPPDTHGAVGLSQFTEVTNGEGVSVFSKGGPKQKQTSFASFFNYTTRSIFDPRVAYDKTWNRWVIVAEAFQESSTIQRVFLAASTTSNAAGSYCTYSFDVPEPAGDFFDFPDLGMDQDAVIITANIFTGNTYVRSRMFAPPKAAIYNCLGFSVPYFNLGTSGTLAPPIVEDNNTCSYLLSFFSSTTLKLFRGCNLGRSGASVVLQANVPIPAVSPGPPMRQPGDGSLGPPTGRFQSASTQIGLCTSTEHTQLLNIHTVATGSFPTPKWYQVDACTNTVPAGRSGFVFESGTSDDSNPSIVGSSVGGTAANRIGRMFVTWSATNAVDANPAVRHQVRVKGSGRLATDAVNIVGGSTFRQAGVAYNPTADNPERWGDYSEVTIDPVAVTGCPRGQRAWLVNEVNVLATGASSATLWGSQFGRLGYC